MKRGVFGFVFIMLVVLATPAMSASGYSRWGVTARVTPSPAQATVSPAAGYSEFTDPSAEYTATASRGFDIKSVIVDGRATNFSPARNSHSITFLNNRLLHSLQVVTVPEKYDITTAATGKGTFSPLRLLKVPFGSPGKSVRVVPHKGWKITDIKDNGELPAKMFLVRKGQPDQAISSVAEIPPGGEAKVVYDEVAMSHAITASFEEITGVSAYLEPPASTSLNLGSDGKVSFHLYGTRSRTKAGTLAYSWSVSGTPADGATVSEPTDPFYKKPGIIFFTATKPGTYIVTLTASQKEKPSETATTSLMLKVNQPTLTASLSCARCHSDDSRLSTDPLFGGNIGNDFASSGHANNVEGKGASCATCHGTHTAMTRRPYDSCGSCHQVGVDGLQDRHFDGHSLTFAGKSTIADCGTCHNAHTATRGSVNGCASCHNPVKIARAPHFSNISASYASSKARCDNCHVSGNVQSLAALKQWKASGHADPDGSAWRIADFKNENGCVRCHTTTGFVAYSTGRVTTAWGTAGDRTKEVLRCDGCHRSPIGVLRALPPYTAVYSNYSTYLFPNAEASNICIACHSGTDSGSIIRFSEGNFSNLPYIEPHATAVGGIVYAGSSAIKGGGGYQYASRSYTKGHYDHFTIGAGDGSGPCVGCHLKGNTAGHTFMPLSSATGEITAFRSTVCNTCHGTRLPKPFTLQQMNDNKSGMGAALETLRVKLQERGIFYRNGKPYFFEADLVTPFTRWDSVLPGQGKDVMGTAFNYQLLRQDPGAYAHNHNYAVRLTQDSIDFIDDGVFNGSYTATIASVVPDKTAVVDYFFSADCLKCHTMHQWSFTSLAVGETGEMPPADNSNCLECHSDKH